MNIYISGPISLGGTVGPSVQAENVQRFHERAARLRELGHTVFSPVELPDQACWEDYMKLCLPAVCDADQVVVLDGWELSRGARLEVFLARELGITVSA